MEQSELKYYRNAFYEDLEHFHLWLGLARKAHNIQDRVYLASKAEDARRRALSVVKDFLARSAHTSASARSKSSATRAC